MCRPFCVPVKKKQQICVCKTRGKGECTFISLKNLHLQFFFFVCVFVFATLHDDVSAADWLCMDSSGLIDAE